MSERVGLICSHICEKLWLYFCSLLFSGFCCHLGITKPDFICQIINITVYNFSYFVCFATRVSFLVSLQLSFSFIYNNFEVKTVKKQKLRQTLSHTSTYRQLSFTHSRACTLFVCRPQHNSNTLRVSVYVVLCVHFEKFVIIVNGIYFTFHESLRPDSTDLFGSIGDVIDEIFCQRAYGLMAILLSLSLLLRVILFVFSNWWENLF